jgi:hypothetical protein
MATDKTHINMAGWLQM